MEERMILPNDPLVGWGEIHSLNTTFPLHAFAVWFSELSAPRPNWLFLAPTWQLLWATDGNDPKFLQTIMSNVFHQMCESL